ncbi:hypothetical protein FOL47_003336 [Perkinsus chesapeaki]|uniref:Uncharacterized protein n=1 Tax=Perkinsus chesapeaki TaxID=330153 RepID=A0A7J6M8P0_PERCH|nr:hypothetical protein FOL47_003336 [Perkinsus chesapeaki]
MSAATPNAANPTPIFTVIGGNQARPAYGITGVDDRGQVPEGGYTYVVQPASVQQPQYAPPGYGYPTYATMAAPGPVYGTYYEGGFGNPYGSIIGGRDGVIFDGGGSLVYFAPVIVEADGDETLVCCDRSC